MVGEMATTPSGKYRYVSPMSVGSTTKRIDGALWKLGELTTRKEDAHRAAREYREFGGHLARVEHISKYASLAWFRDKDTDKPKTSGYAVWVKRK